MEFRKHLIGGSEGIKAALNQLNDLAADAILFVVDEQDNLLGSLTDGDIRRGFIRGLTVESSIGAFIQADPIYIRQNQYSIQQLDEYRRRNLKIIPIVDKGRRIIDILNLRLKSSLLPLDAIIMAGGRGERLKPLTDSLPKPLLVVGDKPILEHNIDRLVNYGISKVTISIGYLGDLIRAYFGDGSNKEVDIKYVEERNPLGTFGAISLIDDLVTEHILVMNSDLLTNIDFADFYKTYLDSGADLMVASIPYQVKIPYAILQVENGTVLSFDEKPTYDYYSNGGIYLFKKTLLAFLQKGVYFDATDFMELLISKSMKVAHYPILGYWLDIGRPEDFEKAQKDILHIKF